MIEFKTENQETFSEEHNQLASVKTAIVYVPACENEIKIENEFFLSAKEENIGDPELTHRKTSSRNEVLNVLQCRRDLFNDNGVTQKKVNLTKQITQKHDVTTHACNDCDAKLASRKGLLSHCRKKHEKYFCNECDKVSHKPVCEITEWKCDFENCDFTCSNRSGLIYHALRHKGEKHDCTLCQKSFWRLQDHARHLKTHTGERPYACDICPKVYASLRTLKSHKRSHTGEKPFICKFCPKAFAHSTSKKQHERVHTGEKPYACKLCNKLFRTSTGLLTHRRTHTGEKRYMCKVCQLPFRQPSHLKAHQTVHTGEKRHVCDVCQVRFALIGHLLTHKKIHTRGKPFSCKECQLSFSLKSQLATHVKIHSKGQVFFCAHCGKVYLGKRSLKAHLRKCYNEHGFEDRI